MSASILNCKLKFQCPNNWDALDASDNVEERYCRMCAKTVHWCKTEEEVSIAAKSNQCVAFQSNSIKLLGLPSDRDRSFLE